MVLGTIYGLSDFVRSGRGKSPDLVRRIDETAPGLWPLGSPEAGLENQVHLVRPFDVDFSFWCWAPTSGNCFRRDVLQLVLNNERLAELRSCTDAYLIRAVARLVGSALIDRPLAVYRLHGMNVFSKHPHLYCMLSYERGGPSDNDFLARKMVIDHLIDKAELFLKKMEDPRQYMSALIALDGAWPRIPSTVAGCKSYGAGKAVSESARLMQGLGLYHYFLLLKWLKVAPHTILLTFLRRKGRQKAAGA